MNYIIVTLYMCDFIYLCK